MIARSDESVVRLSVQWSEDGAAHEHLALHVTHRCLTANSRLNGIFADHSLPRQPLPVEMEIRDEMQRIALEFPAYGYRRITAELQHRGFDINHKRVLRMMHQDNLLCVRRRAFVVTTDSRHHLPVYPNLARALRLDAINQLWIADITYIRLRTEFVYLAVVLDAFSRRVIGWALGRTLEAELAVAALRMALQQRQPAGGLVHHSDRGVQYASAEYTALARSQNSTNL